MARRTIAQMEQEIAALKEAYEAEVSTLRSQVAAAEKARDDIIQALMEEARARDWCSEFEDFIENNNIDVPEDLLPEWDVTVSLTGVEGLAVETNGLTITPTEGVEIVGVVRSLSDPEERWDSWGGADNDKVEAMLRAAGHTGVTFTGFSIIAAARR